MCYFCSGMAQKLIQTQQQKLAQTQKLTQQQMLMVRLLEMPLTELEHSVTAEIDDNPALESQPHDGDDEQMGEQRDEIEANGDESFDDMTERIERQDALDEALKGIGMDDEMPTATRQYGMNGQTADYEEMTYGDTVSFYDRLKEQMGEVELQPRQREVIEYLIGSLDGDGLLRKDLSTLSDELAIYHNIDVSEEEIEDVLHILQTFDPAGIGARTLKECLRLQVERKGDTPTKALMLKVIDKCFDDFMGKRWDRITQQLNLTDVEADNIHSELLRLNPKPGSSLGETEGRSVQQITPDFIIDTADDGSVGFSVNNGELPQLFVSPSFAAMVKEYQGKRGKISRMEKEALVYAREKVERAKGYIDAIRQRQHTMYVTMKAIISIQKTYFLTGDEADLKPMILKDVADRTGLDISTVSRVSNMKYAQTRWGTFRLRHFFSESVRTEDGQQMSTRSVKAALKDIVEAEDKANPLSDERLQTLMQDKGYPVARRTIAKYREQMGIPVARLRKR